MNYEKIYFKIIDKANLENRKKGGSVHYEKHHIKPRSLFKELEKDNNNIVLLTPKEHFICHMLLERIYDCRQMKYAIWRMCNDKTYKVSSRYYEYVKNKIVTESSRLNKGRKLSEEHKRKISLGLSGRTHSEEVKAKMRNSYDPSKHIVSDELRKKLSENATKRFKGIKKSDEFRKHLSEIMSGSGNTMYGKCNKDFMTEEAYEQYRKNLSKSLKGHIVTDETRKKIGEKTKSRSQGGMNPMAKKVRIVGTNELFGTITECAKKIGVNRYTITKHRNGNFSDVNGYKIEFFD